ncbi:hypothetical protein [Tateyamaria sp. ANG-S1]|uniref:hypothetical protein n=1 Tax=Tateyamaria sp. ANG-S1 TaxID=1577905 RepID=UPI001269DE58|nr:hypothetical protein [Tateyamaria sp. ANG-S1]
MTAASFRSSLRWFHVVGGLIVGTYLYSPWSANAAFAVLTLYVVTPALVLSGIAMWKQGVLMRLFRRIG